MCSRITLKDKECDIGFLSRQCVYEGFIPMVWLKESSKRFTAVERDLLSNVKNEADSVKKQLQIKSDMLILFFF